MGKDSGNPVQKWIVEIFGLVVGGVHEGLRHELPVELVGDLALVLQLRDDVGVLPRVRDHRYGLVVLGGGADHAGSADVDVLDDLVERDSLLEDRLFEGVEVHHDHVNGFDPLGGDGVHVLLDVPAGENACVNHWVERLDASVQHLGESRDLGHLGHRDPVLFQKFVRPARRDDLDTHGSQLLGEVDDAGLIRDADDGSADF